MKKSKVSEILYNIFGDDAIKTAAICEQLEDIKYCTEHKMNHLNGGSEKEKWQKAMQEAENLASNDKTFTIENMKKFRKAVDEAKKNDPTVKLYDGLTEKECFAVRKFYYLKNY